MRYRQLSMLYIEANLKRELDNVRRASMINIQLEPDVVYSNAAVKKMIQDEYDRLGMNAGVFQCRSQKDDTG